ncbi:hypothetical protein GCM10017044_12120 [Kordiimonas sediminis]|uniref:PAS domain-containing protein n=1 Tax=Kordiimonas sediminis TaxID=1735581 RepID=A0A919AQD1_9PROT|nr:PAS domain-containing protein [Kordiimonas sediminis]GHF19143.1 hypothetical protein GCM10017044_12120 [Kordiimonas sediminis]
MNSPKSLEALCISDQASRLVDIWHEERVRENALCPQKASLSMVKLKTILPYIYLSKWEGTDALVLQISGTQLDAWLGKNLAGIDLLSLFQGDEIQKNVDFYQSIRTKPCAGKVTRRRVTLETNLQFDYTTIQLPLFNAEGQVSHIIGVGHQAMDAYDQTKPVSTDFSKTVANYLEHIDIGAGI